jgi:hypothetical protein
MSDLGSAPTEVLDDVPFLPFANQNPDAVDGEGNSVQHLRYT